MPQRQNKEERGLLACYVAIDSPECLKRSREEGGCIGDKEHKGYCLSHVMGLGVPTVNGRKLKKARR